MRKKAKSKKFIEGYKNTASLNDANKEKLNEVISERLKKRTESVSLTFNYCENPENAKGSFLFFDCETTGLPIFRDAPIDDVENWPRVVQIAWLLFDSERKLISAEDHYIIQSKPIPANATRINHITDELVKEKGVDIKIVLEKFKKDILNSECAIAHNAAFDVPIIEAEFVRSGFEKAFIKKRIYCTMEDGREYCKLSKNGHSKYKAPTLEELFKECFYRNESSVKMGENHNSMYDVRVLAKCFFQMMDSQAVTFHKQKLNTLELFHP